jgi:Fe-Mn family superoxide dismutase
MAFELPALPYPPTALAPHISEETLNFHHGKHHAGYIRKLNELIGNTPYARMTLEEIVCAADGAIYNNAAQAWNHAFYWQCLSPAGSGGKPEHALLAAIERDFGSVDGLREAFMTAAAGLFGSGWTWLVQDVEGRLSVENTGNAGNPLTTGRTPLLVCDVWEHAYYIDYRNARPDYLQGFWALVNWPFVASNLGTVPARRTGSVD